MVKPVIITVDDDPQVVRAVERDLRRRYAREYRVLRAESGEAPMRKIRKRRTPIDSHRTSQVNIRRVLANG